MHPVDDRMTYWVDVLADVLRQPLTTFPRSALMSAFQESFEVTGVAWRWSDTSGFGVDMTPELAGGFGRAVLTEPVVRKLMARHGLVRWFTTTRDPGPQTLARVPRSISSAVDQAAVREFLQPARCEQVMSVPHRWRWPHYSAFVLARSGSDFSAEDVEVARRVQRVVCAIDTQVRILGGRDPTETVGRAVVESGLSGRELAVLHLLAQGLTAGAIGRRLGASPRTVQKHLQHIYHKLGVNDRMAAVRVATARHLLSSPRPGPA